MANGGSPARGRGDVVGPPPIGFGPWLVTLYIHVGSENTKRKTEIRVETYPELVPWAHAMCGQPGWVRVMQVGIFERWSDALVFYHQWLQPTRGKTRRIQRGFDLLSQWHVNHGLVMWTQPRTLQEMQEHPPDHCLVRETNKSRLQCALEDLMEERADMSLASIKNVQHMRTN
jgi:hypothetical protein